LSQDITGEAVTEPEKVSLCVSDSKIAECEIVRPRHYELVSWVGAPVPDYSFAIEPEVKERRIDDVLKRLKEGVDDIQDSNNFREFLLTMSKFHDYSIGNLILITMQRPDATRVAGYNTWKDLGRWVKKGEKGIAILAPCLPPKSARVKETEDEGEEENRVTEIKPLYFKVVHVFDISQTEGKPLPEFDVPALIGDANEDLFSSVMHLAESQGVDVSFESRPGQDPAIKGMYSGKIIWIKPEESRAQQLKTLLHEMAHYYSEGVFRMSRRNAETIAESVAFTVGAHYGFDTGVRSFPYVALWAEDKKVLEQNLADIRKVSTRIIDALKTEVTKVAVTS
jgi:antirestriction protein ArdC